jgi:hypothetical protein
MRKDALALTVYLVGAVCWLALCPARSGAG